MSAGDPRGVAGTRELRLIVSPFHNGTPGVGTALGAERLAGDQQLRGALGEAGWSVTAERLTDPPPAAPEIARTMTLLRELSGRAGAATAAGAFPFVLSGNCNSSLGTVAGCGDAEIGVIWFDAHADFDDPAENVSGFFDVMGLAMLTGRGWDALRATIPGHAPFRERNVILAGVRDLEDYQRETLDRSAVTVVGGELDPDAFERAIDELASRVRRVYVHFDLDVLDDSEGRVSEYAAPGGPGLERLLACIGLIGERFEVVAAAIASYDPAFDGDDRALEAARRAAAAIATAGSRA